MTLPSFIPTSLSYQQLIVQAALLTRTTRDKRLQSDPKCRTQRKTIHHSAGKEKLDTVGEVYKVLLPIKD